jgi:UDP-glucose 4-epimerase
MMGKKILVSGGCGYIGSHTIVDLIEHGYEVVSVDNLSNSDESVLEGIFKITGVKVKNYCIDLSDEKACAELFVNEKNIGGVIHFAAFKSVGDSVKFPLDYYKNNLNSLINLLEQCSTNGIDRFVFSSSCSVYGNAEQLPVSEETPLMPPESPYAYTKQIGEQILIDIVRANQSIRFVILRYFNPAGAHHSALIGENPFNVANNLVPVITEFAAGKRNELTVFGNDYPTKDGTCVRDYIHVMDVANAHTLALAYLNTNTDGENPAIFNLGIGEGVSVMEALNSFEHVSGIRLDFKVGARRQGDVISVYADNGKAKSILGWEPRFGIDDIMKSAWAWELVR